MTDLRVRRYVDADGAAWDGLVAGSWNGTFLHSRRFLSYHGDRFRDASLVIEDGKGRPVGVFPAAIDPADERRVVSHPGISYGGVVHEGALQGAEMIAAMRQMVDLYRDEGVEVLRYKATPYVYHRVPSGDDLYALFRLGANRYRSDLAAVIDVAARPEPSSRRRRGLRKAEERGVRVATGPDHLAPVWEVLTETLASRHDARPVHTLAEIELLRSRFPEAIDCAVGTLDGRVVAGVVSFRTPLTVHAQYIGSSEAGREAAALDSIFRHEVERCVAEGTRYFSFGTSTEAEGTVLNEGLYRFKTEFGAGGVTHDFFELPLLPRAVA